jgi:hypothetical protein
MTEEPRGASGGAAMPQRFDPGDLITADIINDILGRLEKLEAAVKKGSKEKEKDTKESKDGKETKEKDTKETEKGKDTKETEKGKDTKETEKGKDAKEVEKGKDAKEVEKGKDAKEVEKGKDTKEQSKDTKESKEGKESKENKENKEEKQEKEQKDRTKEAMSFIEKSINAPFDGGNPFFALGLSAVGADGDESSATIDAAGRAFIRGDERPDVGRRALELADESVESEVTPKPADAAKPVDTSKPGEASDKQAEARN